ncbi:TraB/GumN family protein [Qipengyuania sp. 6B39]|uniref:TraB/GumN family protein n=1 Tax=Qipengyuania proteolytica TaxID=2867239 RepID=UPI001C8A68A1|nr:TraB/GumN family protein [Qipengyuania proteolytica]MBX7496043.1 TraB/GumN family protein [Qipengyuania proteolytica]
MTRNLLLLAAPVAMGLQGCTGYTGGEVASASATAVATPPAAEGPALWKVADEDTTIYLFGTVHALPQDVDWFKGPIATALDSADTLVTEIPAEATSDPAAQQAIALKAMLPPEQSLRGVLGEAKSAKYEAALTELGLPVNAFDRFEPWFAGMTLAVLPLMKNGWTAESGVEKVVEREAEQSAKREALETVEFQVNVFDTLPQESQIAFLMSAIDTMDTMVPMMEQMVAEWLAGDAEGLAELMNQGLSDPQLAKVLLYDRNKTWAEWIDARMDTPGTVFIAVGAGHLAGEKSVQDYLKRRKIAVTRVQ